MLWVPIQVIDSPFHCLPIQMLHHIQSPYQHKYWKYPMRYHSEYWWACKWIRSVTTIIYYFPFPSLVVSTQFKNESSFFLHHLRVREWITSSMSSIQLQEMTYAAERRVRPIPRPHWDSRTQIKAMNRGERIFAWMNINESIEKRKEWEGIDRDIQTETSYYIGVANFRFPYDSSINFSLTPTYSQNLTSIIISFQPPSEYDYA